MPELYKRILMMEDKLRDIVSVFINKPAGEIGPGTFIGKSAIGNSIMIHRMYAKLAEVGVVVGNYRDIDRFETLIQRATGGKAATPTIIQSESIVGNEQQSLVPLKVGMDIESVSSMPQAKDFREDTFYTSNFSPAEIAYCILQNDPLSSFAGLFAAKEAIVKADNRYISFSFNQIQIEHDESGKPIHPEFGLSISHAGGMAAAVAVQLTFKEKSVPSPEQTSDQQMPWIVLSTLACLLAVIALYIAIRH